MGGGQPGPARPGPRDEGTGPQATGGFRAAGSGGWPPERRSAPPGWHDRPMPHYRPAPEYPPLPDHLPAVGAARLPGHRPMPTGRPADRALAPDWPPAPGYRALLPRLAGFVPRRRTAGRPGRRAAVLGYLTVPVFGVPVVIYLATLRGTGAARGPAAQPGNVW